MSSHNVLYMFNLSSATMVIITLKSQRKLMRGTEQQDSLEKEQGPKGTEVMKLHMCLLSVSGISQSILSQQPPLLLGGKQLDFF